MSNLIEVGSIVSYEGGYYRVSADRGTGNGRWFNLASIFKGKIYHKRVPANQVFEAEDEWYAKWTKSETYACM